MTGSQPRIGSLCRHVWKGQCILANMLNVFSMRPSLNSAYAQDTTTRIWDIRQPGKSLAVLSGRMGAVRSLRFSSDGRFLAMAEPADFVHVFDVKGGFHRSDCRCLLGYGDACAVPVGILKDVQTQKI